MIEFIDLKLPSGKHYSIRVSKDENGNIIKEELCRACGDLWLIEREL